MIYGEAIAALGLLGGVIKIIVFVFLIVNYPFNVDKKIKMYTEENADIEQKVKSTVIKYMDYEKETYTNMVQSADLETLVIKYPELNSNELVKMEIETYTNNNKKIKELKEQEIDKRVIGWWLFFNIGV